MIEVGVVTYYLPLYTDPFNSMIFRLHINLFSLCKRNGCINFGIQSSFTFWYFVPGRCLSVNFTNFLCYFVLSWSFVFSSVDFVTLSSREWGSPTTTSAKPILDRTTRTKQEGPRRRGLKTFPTTHTCRKETLLFFFLSPLLLREL